MILLLSVEEIVEEWRLLLYSIRLYLLIIIIPSLTAVVTPESFSLSQQVVHPS